MENFAERYIDLAQVRLGAKACYATDEFFAPKERLLDPNPAVFIPGKYDEHGKWMDGWETRRRRGEGHDYCIIKLGVAGVIRGIDIDTSFFTGNYPPAASIEACYSEGDVSDVNAWTEIVPPTNLKGDTHHLVPVDSLQTWTHLRLNIFPDGGIARLRVYGEPQCNWEHRDRNEQLDLIALQNGGRIITANDSHFGKPENLLAPGRGINMGDGWETRRRREPGNDWVLVALGHAGIIRRVEVDTAHFKGNYPDSCSLQAAYMTSCTDTSLITQSMFWPELMPSQKLQMDRQHVFSEVNELGPVTHVKFNIFPDGGVSRLRLIGQIV